MKQVTISIIVLAVLAGLGGCTKGLTNFAKGISGQYCQETVYILNEETGSYDETCTDDL